MENREKESVSMRMSTRKRTVVSVPYIAQGKMGTPNNFACVGGGEGEGLGPTACRYDVNSRECKTDLGGLQYGPIVHFIYSPPVVMQNEGLATGVCVVCVCVSSCVVCVSSCVVCVSSCVVCVSSPSCSLQASEWCTSPNQVGMCQCNGRGVS